MKMVCKRCGGQISYSRGWKCGARPDLSCVGWTGERLQGYEKSYKTPTTEPKETEMNIDQIIESYTYARVTGSAKPLDHLDAQAIQIIQNSSQQVQDEIDVLFANDEYEAKLRFIRNENANRES